MIVRYDDLDEKLRDLPVVDPPFHDKCIRVLRGGDYRRHGLLLYGLVRALRPSCVVDVGTARGYTAVVMARAMEDAGVDGVVYTIDTLDSDTPRDWHAPKWGAADPAAGRLLTRRELLEPFRSLVDRRIVFLTGRSIDTIPKVAGEVDLAFLDASPEYEDVIGDARLLLEQSAAGLCVAVDGFDPTDDYEIVPRRLSRIITGSVPRSYRPAPLLERAAHHLVRRWIPARVATSYPRAGYEGLIYKRSRCPGVTKAVFELARVAERLEIVPIEDETATWRRDDYGVAILTFARRRTEESAGGPYA